MHHLAEVMNSKPRAKSGKFAQDGVKYRSLCAQCNNQHLGRDCDPEFNRFCRAVSEMVQTKLVLPPKIDVRARPQPILRAVLGHLAAQGIGRYQKGPNTEEFRDYLLDSTLDLPDFLEVYYWIYPYNSQLIMRDCAIQDIRTKDTAPVWLMKFFPVAFLVTWDNPLARKFGSFARLSDWRTAKFNEEVDLAVNLAEVPHERWPETPDNDHFLLVGQEAIRARARS